MFTTTQTSRMLVMQLEIPEEFVCKSAMAAKELNVPVLLKTSPLQKMSDNIRNALKCSSYAIVNELEACVLLEMRKE